MTLEEKVKRLVRYCGQHQSHGFMVDERNTDEDFNVVLPEERQIRETIGSLKVIILTGEAGDGKSRILRNLGPLLEEAGFSEPCGDFSALTEEKKKELILRLGETLAGRGEEKLVILANVGVFTQNAIKYNIQLMEELTRGREDVFLRNFEKRNLAEEAESFRAILESFFGDTDPCPNQECPCHERCAYRENIKKLLAPSGTEAMRTICNAVYLKGGHITFRELLSLAAYAVTFGQSCEERRRYLEERGDEEKVSYYNIFEENDDLLLRKIADMDPALRRGDCPEEIQTKKQYVSYRRREFFERPAQHYQMLHADYLVQFYEVLTYMNQPPYHYDASRDSNQTLLLLKQGINKLSSRDKSDRGLVVADKPVMFDGKIRTEFLGMQDISLIWNRYGLQPGVGKRVDGGLLNRFCLSYPTERAGKRELISLVIDYRLFRYLMLCSEDYFMYRNGLNIEENAVNTFYRKILQVREQAYESILIRFEEKSDEICDFSLMVHSEEDIFTGEKRRSIRIRRED